MICSIGHSACRAGYKTLYIDLPRFIEELPIAHADGSYKKLNDSEQLLKIIASGSVVKLCCSF